jgi:hypothetical protein
LVANLLAGLVWILSKFPSFLSSDRKDLRGEEVIITIIVIIIMYEGRKKRESISSSSREEEEAFS